MRIISTIIITFILSIVASSNLFSQTTGRTLSLDTVTVSGQYIARDWIELQPGFSFTATSPTSMVPQKIKVTWYLSGKYVGWKPYLTLNSQQVYGSEIEGVVNIYTLYGTVNNLSSELQEIFETTDGWAYYVNYNTDDNYVYLEISHPSNFELGLNYNYEACLLEQNYAPATDGTFTAEIDRSLIVDTDYLVEQPDIDRNLDYSLPVGTIPGVFNVSSTGAATYTMPIEVPPGTMGMQPQLSVVYNSQGGNGLLGMSFDLAGLSAITRTTKTQYSNGTIAGITFTRDDMFALDGNKLVLTSGTYGVNSSVYATENETFSRITAYGSVGNGPQWFKVETKDGKTLEYGREEDSRLAPKATTTILVWKLNKITDANGNYVKFTYYKENYESVVSKIEYTGNEAAGLEAYNTIEFLYAEKEDTCRVYVAGQYINQTLILESIRVKHEENLLREYLFNYTHDVYSHLSEIELRNRYNEKLNSMAFNWGEYNKFIAKSSITLPADNYQSVAHTERFWTTGDINGDGVFDLLSIFPYKVDLGGGSYTWKNVCQPFYSVLNTCTPTFTTGTSYEFLSDLIWEDFNCFKSSPCVNNMNGDNKPDVVIPYFNKTSSWSEFLFIILSEQTSQGTRLLGQQLLSSTEEMPAYVIDDLNNDGIDDILFIEKSKVDGIYPGKICYRQNNWMNTVGWETFNVSLTSAPEKIFINDFNADGLNEVMVITDDNYKIYPNENGVISSVPMKTSSLLKSTYDMEPGDFNDDGLMDFICTKDQEWFVAYSNGQGGFSRKTLYHITHDVSVEDDDGEEFILVTDFNNDGKSDFIVGDLNSSNFYTYWYTSTVTNFVLSKTAISSEESNANSKRLVKGDFNGDGREDLIYYGYDFYNQSTENQTWRIYCSFNSTSDEGRVKAILDGYSRKTELQYLPLTRAVSPDEENFYVKGTSCSYPLNDIQAPLYCLWKVTAPNGDGSTNTTEYAYSEAKIHNRGLGFLGFKEVTAQNETFDRKTKTTNTLHDTFFKLTKQVNEVTTTSADGISKEEINYAIDTLDGEYFSRPYSIVQTDFLTHDTLTTTYNYETDENNYPNGNITEIQKNYGNGFTEITTLSQYVSAGSYTANKPRYVEVARQHPDDINAFYNWTLSSYDSATGNLQRIINNYSITGKEVTTTYSNYNHFGQPGTVTQSAPDVTSMVTGYSYDDKGLFVEEETNAIGTITYENDPAFGKTTSVTGINGKTAYSYYNNWGTLEKSLSADSVSTHYEINWAADNGPANALYYTYTQPEGQPWVKTWYDSNGKVLREESIGFNNISIHTDYTYTSRGEVNEKTTYMGGSVTAQVDYDYYDDGRLQAETYLGGKVISYVYDENTVQITTDGKTYSKTYDNWGNVASAEEPSPGGEIEYNYYSNGKPSQIISPASTTISITYDETGNQTSLTDPDAGTIRYNYDAFGRLIYQRDNKGNEDSVHYDFAGRIDYKRNHDNEVTDYEYVTSGNGIGQLKKITAPNGSCRQYDYDEYGRTVKTTQHIDGTISDIVFEYRYNEMGQVDTILYPGNFKIDQTYDNFGNLVTVKNGSTTIWELNEQTASKLKYFLGNNGLYTEKNYDEYGFMTSCSTKIGSNVVQYQYYAFNPVNGLLGSMEDRRSNYLFKEQFTYDDLYRLTNWNVTKDGITVSNNSQTYKTDASGNIGYKSGIGYYDYLTHGPHALDSLTTVSGCPEFNDQAITYTVFNKVATITENDSLLTLTYGPDEQRIKSELTDGGTLVKTCYYGGLYEKIVTEGGATRELLYIPAGDGLAAVYCKNSVTGDSLYCLHKDHLGSIVSITDEDGNIVEEYNYDPWGRRRNPLTWDFTDVSAPAYLARGFTGHEHLDVFGLINMNGRVYDPFLGIFLSPDNYIQAPDFSQNFNRYGYCLNNPLKYTDPSGDYAFLSWIVGGVIGGISNVLQHHSDIMDGNLWEVFRDWNIYYNIGNVAGSTGAAAGSLVDKGLSNSFGINGGIIGGGASGGIGGFVGGFIQETLNSLYEGESFNDAVDNGWSNAKEGLGWGAAIGALTGGLDALREHRNIFTGQEKVNIYLRSDGRPVPDVHNDNIMESMHNSSAWTEGEKAYYDKLYNQIGFTESNAYPNELSIDVPNYVRVTDVKVHRYGFLPNQKFNLSVNGQSPISLSKVPGNDIWYNLPVKNVHSLRMWISGPMFKQTLNEITVNVPHRTLIQGFYWTPFLHFF